MEKDINSAKPPDWMLRGDTCSPGVVALSNTNEDRIKNPEKKVTDHEMEILMICNAMMTLIGVVERLNDRIQELEGRFE